MNRHKVPAIIVAVPIILVNIVAMIGQYSFLREHLSAWGIPGAILFASALESTAIYLAAMAYAALISGDSATRLRLASYGFGIIIGLMNGSHYLADGRLTFAAIALGIMSASSPWLWAVYSRRQSRDKLMAQGLIEGHAVRLGFNRWLLHPVRSLRVFSRATWIGETEPAEAIALAEPAEFADMPESAFGQITTKADAVRYAVNALATLDGDKPDVISVKQVATYLQEHADRFPEGANRLAYSYISDVLRRDRAARDRLDRARLRAIETRSPDHE